MDVSFILLTSLFVSSVQGVSINEINALLELKHSFIDVNDVLSSWSSISVDKVCSWHGIDCNEDNHISKITLTNSQLSGIVPTQIADLTYLEELYLNLNENITGNLPNVMGLSKLRILRLELNSFNGGFYFHRASNWNTPLGHSLQEIWVDENQLSGTIESSSPESFSSSPIQVLRYGKQGFYGALPSGYEGFPNLQDLRIGFNDFEGSVPEGWRNMTQLHTLYLPNMPKVCGPIPEFEVELIGENFALTPFGSDCEEPPLFHEEEIELLLQLKDDLGPPDGVLSSWSLENQESLCEANNGWLGVHCNEYNYIKRIQLDQLGLLGTIPALIKDFRFLETLSLSGNLLQGTLPRLQTSGINHLNFSNNSITGVNYFQEASFWETKLAASLSTLKLDLNELTGSIQDGVEFMFWRSSLQVINLAGNQLQGTLPSGWNGLLQLKQLDLSGNAFHGSIPDWTSIPQIEEIDLFDTNEICGMHPDWIQTSPSHRTTCEDSTLNPEILRERILSSLKESDLYLQFYGGVLDPKEASRKTTKDFLILGGVLLITFLVASSSVIYGLYKFRTRLKI